jgi:hypothetical protein
MDGNPQKKQKDDIKPMMGHFMMCVQSIQNKDSTG